VPFKEWRSLTCFHYSRNNSFSWLCKYTL